MYEEIQKLNVLNSVFVWAACVSAAHNPDKVCVGCRHRTACTAAMMAAEKALKERR